MNDENEFTHMEKLSNMLKVSKRLCLQFQKARSHFLLNLVVLCEENTLQVYKIKV